MMSGKMLVGLGALLISLVVLEVFLVHQSKDPNAAEKAMIGYAIGLAGASHR